MITKTCIVSGKKFTITEEDLKFYEKLGVPAPTLCPEERYRKRLIHRNERNLYQRKCSATGQVIISIFDKDVSFPVYHADYWWSDHWDGADYGRDFDFSADFFAQFSALFAQVPQVALNAPQSENSLFTNQSQKNKNCYLVFCSGTNEDCLHGMWFQNCRNCIDCLYLEESELCYQVINGKRCYQVTFSRDMENCYDCSFCRDCIGCKNCFGCVNLRNKEYYFLNEKLSPHDYRQKIKELRQSSAAALNPMAESFEEFSLRFPFKYFRGKNNENSYGDSIQNNKNAHNSFNCRDNENTNNCQDTWRARNCYDLTETIESDFCLEIEGATYNQNCLFCPKINFSSDLNYCSHCHNCKNCFGCVGLRQKQYCIQNKQYTKDEYEKLRGKIVEHMKKTGEWGEFFPISMSPFAYNETVAQEYFPLDKISAEKLGYRWRDNEPSSKYIASEFTVPDDIADVTDEICDQILTCAQTGKHYKIQLAELKFYRQMNLPIPRLCPDARHEARMKLRNPRKLWDRNCDECEKDIQTTFAPDRPEKVLCEECYLQTVI